MTHVTTAVSAFTETPRMRSEFYRRCCSLPTVVDPETGRITMQAGLVGAVMMPIPLALRVKAGLDGRGIAPLSIVGHPRAAMWTFLVRADMRPIGDHAVLASLWRERVIVVSDGEIALPSPAQDPLMVRTWVSPAAGTFRPSGAVVIECTRACLSEQARR